MTVPVGQVEAGSNGAEGLGGPRLAVNPIAYWLVSGTADKSTATLGAALGELADIGYRAVKADVPSDMAAEQYLPWLAGFGLEPSLSLFSGSFEDSSSHAQTAEQARRFAAVQSALGLSVCMISTTGQPGSVRREYPAVGAGFDEDRLQVIVDGVAHACQAMLAEGVRPALHPHVGGWIETEHETRTVLDGVGADLLGFGPDTGHMAWAGMDTLAMLTDYSDIIVGVHLKDTFEAGIAAAKAEHLEYRVATQPGRLWAEPGTGQQDLDAYVAAFSSSFTGDYMIEIDVPSLPRRRSHQVAYDWAVAHLPLPR